MQKTEVLLNVSFIKLKKPKMKLKSGSVTIEMVILKLPKDVQKHLRRFCDIKKWKSFPDF